MVPGQIACWSDTAGVNYVVISPATLDIAVWHVLCGNTGALIMFGFLQQKSAATDVKHDGS